MKEKFKILLNNLPLACLVLEPVQGGYIVRDANDEYFKLTSKAQKDLFNSSFKNFFQGRGIIGYKKIEASLNQTVLAGKITVFQCDKYNASKAAPGVIWEITHIPIKERNGDKIDSILHLLSKRTAEDREEKGGMNAQRELERREAENQCFIKESKDGLFSLNQQGDFLTVNNGFVNLAEISAEQLLKMSFLPFCAPQHREQILENFIKAHNGENQNFETIFTSYKGKTIFLDVSLMPMKINGEVLGVYGIAKDITDKKLSEQKISEQQDQLIGSEKRFKALVQSSSDLIGILDLDGTYKFVSDSTFSILGTCPEEFIGKNVFDFIHPEDKEAIMETFIQVQKKEQVKISSFRFKDSEGKWRWLETTVTNFMDDPYIQGYVTNSRDITETRALWLETRKRNKVLKEIAWEHAHIVRAPIVRLKGLLNLLAGGDCKEWTQEDVLRLINYSVEELDEIVSKTIKKTEDVEIKFE